LTNILSRLRLTVKPEGSRICLMVTTIFIIVSLLVAGSPPRLP
jgi:hypothetical protein